MSIAQAFARPPRCVLVNVTTGEAMECLFNPAQLSEKVSVNYNRLTVPGLSHQVLQYQSTGNRSVPSVEFYLDRFLASEEPNAPDILDFRAFIRALTAPPGATHGVVDTAPPRTLIIWPDVVVLETVVTEVAFGYQLLGLDGQVLAYTATVSFEEILDERVTSEALRRDV